MAELVSVVELVPPVFPSELDESVAANIDCEGFSFDFLRD